MTYRLIIDLNNHVHRARVKGETLQASNGTLTGILYYSISMLKNLCETYRPVQVIFACDNSYNPARIKYYPGYKQNRRDKVAKRTPEELLEYADFERQRAIFRQVLDTLPVHVVDVPNVEADDIIGLLAHISNYFKPFTLKGNLKHTMIVVSSDKDFRHIVSENLQVFDPQKRIMFTQANTNVKRELFEKMLLGDKGDGIEGIPGVGEKTVEPALRDIPFDLDNLSSFYVECLKSRNRRIVKIAHSQDVVERNRKIISLRYGEGLIHEVPHTLKEQLKGICLGKVPVRPTNWEDLLKLCYENEFRSMCAGLQNYFSFVSNIEL